MIFNMNSFAICFSIQRNFEDKSFESIIQEVLETEVEKCSNIEAPCKMRYVILRRVSKLFAISYNTYLILYAYLVITSIDFFLLYS